MALEFIKENLKSFLALSPDSEELKQLEKEILEGFDPADAVRAHKEELLYLQDALDALEVMDAEFSPSIHALQALEEGYLRVLMHIYGCARRFHPLTGYGREMLSYAEGIRKRFEWAHLPLVTALTEENADFFESLLSEDVLEEIMLGDLKGLGIFRRDFDETLPAAAAAYRLIDIPETEDGAGYNTRILDLQWLFVDPEFRSRGAANQIIGELVSLMIREKADAFTTAFVPDEDYEIVVQLLSEWGFELSAGLTPEFRASLSETDKNPVPEEKRKVTPLHGLSKKDLQILFTGYSGNKEAAEKLESRIESGYFEEDLSGFAESNDSPDGLMLIHKKPSGRISIEFLDWKDEDMETGRSLLSFLASQAMKKYGKETVLCMQPESEEQEELLDDVFPSQLAAPCVEAVLTPPEKYWDVTVEDVAKLVGQSRA